ncbi:pyocin activator PrtN family protein [Pseudomonas sp. Pseusp16]|uniref:pyocin activator PrtN family protein n=1 Tax=Pseudomonas sp. Pseusp16 TaxID=3243021 RepID=UPI0039B6D3CD
MPWGEGGDVTEVTADWFLDVLQRQYGSVCIPLEVVRRQYLGHLGMPQLLRKIGRGRITLRVVKSDWGGRTQRVVYLHDLAEWLAKGGDSRPPT